MSKVVGYQWGSRNQFIGEYDLNAYDEQSKHMPPHTTFIAPPTILEGKEAIWNGADWILENSPEPIVNPVPQI